MGLLEALKGNRIYLDANIWIYALQGISPYTQPLLGLFKIADGKPLTIIISELSLAEILVRPIRRGSISERENYTQVITSIDGSIAAPIGRSTFIQAAKVRAATKLKLPDAAHAASAMENKCTTFLTNDKQFRTVAGLHVVLRSQVLQNADND